VERLWGKRAAAVVQGGYRWERRVQKESPEGLQWVDRDRDHWCFVGWHRRFCSVLGCLGQTGALPERIAIPAGLG